MCLERDYVYNFSKITWYYLGLLPITRNYLEEHGIALTIFLHSNSSN